MLSISFHLYHGLPHVIYSYDHLRSPAWGTYFVSPGALDSTFWSYVNQNDI